MISQKTDYPDTPDADYSSVRMQVENQSRGFASGIDDVMDDKVTFSSHTKQVASGNQNLSSVLSQIQDDGPAYAGLPKRDNLINLPGNKKKSYQDQQQFDSVKQGYSQPDPTVERQQINNTASHAENRNAKQLPASATAKTMIWLLSALLMIVMSVAAFYLYRLDTRTDQLIQSLVIKQVKKNVLAADITTSNELFTDVKNNPEQVKEKNFTLVDNKEGSAVSVLSDSELTPLAKAKQSATDIIFLKDEIVLLKSELAAANNKLVVKNNKIVGEKKSNEGHKVSHVQEKELILKPINNTVISGWVVNLASFTERDRASNVAEKILPTGFEPLIEVANVNGKKMFRLIVSGFNDRGDAEAFVDLAADIFGLKGGWIRKASIN